MLDVKIIQDTLEKISYEDVSVLDFTCAPFVDKVILIFDISDPCKLTFIGCRKVCVEHPWGKIDGTYWSDLPISEWDKAHLINTFMMRKIKVRNIRKYDIDLYEFSIDLDLIKINIICNDIEINDQRIEDFINDVKEKIGNIHV